jgi:hypothetical protein
MPADPNFSVVFPKRKTAGVSQLFTSKRSFGFWTFTKTTKTETPHTKKMKCEDLQLNLPLYTDDVLTAASARA